MRDCTPTREEARALSAHQALIPVYREVLADMLTPVRAYTLLCPPDEPGFLLESVEGGERLARYSFIGAQARALDLDAGNPLDALARVAGEETAPVRGIPRFHGGAVGYLGFNGDMDVAIAIRTAVLKDGKLHVQAAAGIVADSDPRSEWLETQHKARALLRAAWP